MNIIVNGDYYGRSRHGLGDFLLVWLKKLSVVARPQPIPPLDISLDTYLFFSKVYT